MSNELTLGVKLAGKIQDALERNKIPDLADLDWLASGDNLACVRRIRLGHDEIIAPEHIIDCDADPLIVYEGYSVEKHRKGGAFKWDVTNVTLYREESQMKGGGVLCDKIRSQLSDKPAMNVCVLDYLLANPHLIPEEWQGKRIYFWGTIYRCQRGHLYVPTLCWVSSGKKMSEKHWISSVDRLDEDYVHVGCYAAVDAR